MPEPIHSQGSLRDQLCELVRAWAPRKWWARLLRRLLLRELDCPER